jgi:hypothetical protein
MKKKLIKHFKDIHESKVFKLSLILDFTFIHGALPVLAP